MSKLTFSEKKSKMNIPNFQSSSLDTEFTEYRYIWVAFIGIPIKNFLDTKHNFTIPVHLIFNSNHKKLPKFSVSTKKIMKRAQ